MDPISVDALLLRTQLPDLSLRLGSSIVARVASRGEGHGVLVLAGIPLKAELPEEVGAGETLRLTVSEVTSERITLRMDPSLHPGAAAAAPPPPPPPRLEVSESPRRGRAGDGERASVVLAFESAALGRLDLGVEITAGLVSVEVAAPAGQALELAQDGAAELKESLESSVGRRASVRVGPRREPLDLYA
jgi:hypothetical protein